MELNDEVNEVLMSAIESCIISLQKSLRADAQEEKTEDAAKTKPKA